MATIIIEDVPESVVKTFGNRIPYSNKIIFPKKKDIEDMTLLEYIKSEEYKNEVPIFFTPEEFLADLQKYKNKTKYEFVDFVNIGTHSQLYK